MSYSPFRKLNPPEKLKIFLLKQNPKKSNEDYIYTTYIIQFIVTLVNTVRLEKLDN